MPCCQSNDRFPIRRRKVRYGTLLVDAPLRPMRIGGRWLFDGALVNPVPVSVCRALGARYVIEGSDSRLRFPVGPDALSFLGWRGAVSDEDWVGLGGLKRDADYFERVFMDTGVDLRSK